MKLHVDKEKVLRFLGYGKRKTPKVIEKKIDQELDVYDRYMNPEYHMKSVTVDIPKEGTVSFNNEISLKSDYLYEKLKDTKKAYVMVYTVGEKIEAIIDKYSEDAEMMRAMIIDKIGVVALDNLRDQLVEKIEDEEYPQVISSTSYPSQGDFKVEYQSVLFDLFKDEKMNISISESSQFTPLKTVLLIYGLGEEKDTTSMCDACDDKCNN